MRILIACVLLAVLAGCRQTKSPAESESGLESSDADVRRQSADDLRASGKVPEDAVPKLLIAAKNEKDPNALGAMLVTLGVSGALPARDTICAHWRDENTHVSHAAEHAIDAWLKRNIDQGGCAMSSVQEVPKSEGPSHVDTKPVAPKSWVHDIR